MRDDLPETAAILARLIGEPTISRQSNLALLDYVEELLAPTDARIERFAASDGSRANLWATIGPDRAGGVILSGHTDVVPVEGQAWTCDPFTLTERDGLLFGRGTTDMKGFVASALRAAVMASRLPLTVPLHLALSYDEEIGCIGVRSMIEVLATRQHRPALCIVGEPTSMQIATGHKGKRALKACCHGVEGHSALAPKALNALHLGAEFILALESLQQKLREAGLQDIEYDIPYSTIHAGVMRGGTALNIVPNLCEIDFEIRNIAQDDPALILADIRKAAEQIVARHSNRFPEAQILLEEISGYPGLDTAKSSPAVSWLRNLIQPPPELIKVAFGTEGGLYDQALGMPVLVCGPGSMDQGHKPDEYISRAQLGLCDDMLMRVVENLAERT